MKQMIGLIVIFIILLISTSSSFTLHSPQGTTWHAPGGANLEKGQVTFLSIHWVDYYLGIADMVTIGCDPDVIFCWQITNNGHDLEIGLLVGPPTDSTHYSTITTQH